MSKERMGPHLAVFNGHCNQAENRAIKLLREFSPEYAKEVETVKKTGIMAIFEDEPTPATAAFAFLVTAFVNEHGEDNA